MCDTFVALKNSTSDGSVIFAKNSDRAANESHMIRHFPRQTHNPDEDYTETTHLSIPQVQETYALLLSSPYWLFGCEMGTNEFGVTIGNEAVFTRESERQKGLMGMDINRIALERSKTADEALDCIINLIELYGQGGQHGPTWAPDKYHNSWLIADSTNAWVLETADKFWIAEKIQDVRTISNALTIGTSWDRIHPDAIEYALERGYSSSRKDFHWAKAFTGKIWDRRTWGGKGLKRHKFTTGILKDKKGDITPQTMMDLVRSHNPQSSETKNWDPSKGGMDCICIHTKPLFVPTQSTASMVSQLIKSDLHVHWITGTSAPCTSLFKPLFVSSGLPDLEPLRITPKEKYDNESLWWQHEKVHRLVLQNYPVLIQKIKPDIENYEAKWIEKVQEAIINLRNREESRISVYRELSEHAFKEAISLDKQWVAMLSEELSLIKKRSGGFFYRRHWKNENNKSGFE